MPIQQDTRDVYKPKLFSNRLVTTLENGIDFVAHHVLGQFGSCLLLSTTINSRADVGPFQGSIEYWLHDVALCSCGSHDERASAVTHAVALGGAYGSAVMRVATQRCK